METARNQLSAVIEKVTGLDISNKPYFGTLWIPAIAVVISPVEIQNAWIQETFRSCPLLSETGVVIDEGFTSYMEVSFTDSIL